MKLTGGSAKDVVRPVKRPNLQFRKHEKGAYMKTVNEHPVPAVSVIVPVYNTEKFLSRCIMSLVNQDCGIYYEIIAVNDGSTDSSGEILESLAARYDFIRVVTRENGGLSRARNTGLENARGDYVAFVDSDDFVSPQYIGRLYAAAESADADIVCCNYRNTDEGGARGLDNFLYRKSGCIDGKSAFKAALCDITVRSYVWNKLYRRTLFTAHGVEFPPDMCFEDFAVVPRLFYYADRVAFIPDTLYCYIHRRGSITGSIRKKSVEDYLRAFAMLRRFTECEDIFDSHRGEFYFLRKKISVTVFGMLIRCIKNEPEGVGVLAGYARARRVLKVYSSDRYYFVSWAEIGEFAAE